MATTYSEALLAVRFRTRTEDGRMQGGAMYVLDRGLHMRWLALLFALFGAMASFGIGCAVQVNAIAAVCKESLNISPGIVGLVSAVLAGLVIFGGIQSIAGVCRRLVPLRSLFYIGGCGAILIVNWDFILPALKTIAVMAFSPGAAAGGLAGGGVRMVMRYGIARGLFSNEAGMGSAPIAGGGSKNEQPGSAGIDLIHRNLLGYGSCLCRYRACAGEQYYEKSGDRYGDGRGRRPAYNTGLCPDSHCRAGNPCRGHHYLCLFYDSRMGLLWREMR